LPADRRLVQAVFLCVNIDHKGGIPMEEFSKLATEQIHPGTSRLDEMDSLEIVRLMNEEDRRVPDAIRPILPMIAEVVDRMAETIRQGGHIFYIGAGTSGRLGVLDAAECPPTFSSPPEWFQALIAGGDRALRHAVEGAEDSEESGERDLRERGFTSQDFLIGLAASGRTPYVIGAALYARKIGAKTAAITASPGSRLGRLVDYPLEVDTGPEVLAGSTRLKAGTAQKLILNMLSTATMVRLGKTWGNLMVDLKPANAKLKNRASRIVQAVTGVSPEEAEAWLAACGWEVKTSIFTILAGTSPEEARERILKAGGRLKEALRSLKDG
jgi:N-acetylmuramic acid 6-phosphate etherase